MTDRIPTLDGPPLLVAEGGAHTHAAHSTLESFRLALRLGATSLGIKAWMTADDELVVARDDSLGGLRRRRISSTIRPELPTELPTFDELLDACAPASEFVITLADDRAFKTAIGLAAAHQAIDRCSVRHGDLEVLAGWRKQSDDVRLVNSIRFATLKDGAERRAATLRTLGIDAVEARYDEWSGGGVALFHRFGRRARATDANYPEIIRELLRIGLDAIGGDYPDRLVDAAAGRD